MEEHNKTKKISPKISPKIRTKKKSPPIKKSPLKPKKRLKLVEIAPKLTIDEYEIVDKVEPEELPELVPILHMDNIERPIKEKHNKTVKKLNIIENAIINEDQIASKLQLPNK